MLNHSNLCSNAFDGLEGYDFHRDDLALSFLPLAHVYERTLDYGFLFRGISVAYLEKMETVAEALLEAHPTITAAVPRFFEKMYANILEKGHRETGAKRAIFDWALRVAAKAVPWRAYGREVSGRREARMAHCRQDRLFKDPRRSGRTHSQLRFRRRTAGAGTR